MVIVSYMILWEVKKFFGGGDKRGEDGKVVGVVVEAMGVGMAGGRLASRPYVRRMWLGAGTSSFLRQTQDRL